MSWSISDEGTAEELRAHKHTHEREHWRGMPVTERLMVHHAVGHAVELAEEATAKAGTELRFTLTGRGHESGDGDFHIELALTRLRS